MTSDTYLQTLVYIHALILILAGILIIANYKIGGLFVTISMIMFMLTRDNPLLANSDAVYRTNMQNLLKDLAVAGAGILIYMKKKRIVHRREILKQNLR